MINGLELARAFYADVIEGLLDVPHTACLIGEGSEVLGFDTDRSTDHEWGPRAQIFVDPAEVNRVRERVDGLLPDAYRGYPTRWFSLIEGRDTHHVEINTLEAWLADRLPTIPADEPETASWLAILTAMRQRFAWYPVDLWRWLIASQWHLIGNVEPYLGRTLELGDRRGARLIAARLCRMIMEMAYLQERAFQPYEKWFSRGFSELDAATTLGPHLDLILESEPRSDVDGPVQSALSLLAARHNALDITAAVRPVIGDFAVGVNDAVRPYPVLNTSELIMATVESITDPALRDLPRVGSVDQLTHADDLMINFTGWPGSLAALYREQLGG
jgi:hypothetical protein